MKLSNLFLVTLLLISFTINIFLLGMLDVYRVSNDQLVASNTTLQVDNLVLRNYIYHNEKAQKDQNR